jgi:hypothetical protein
MRCPLFGLLPQIGDRIVIRRIRRQGLHGDPMAMGCQKRLGRCPGVIPCSFMAEKPLWPGLLPAHLHEPLGTCRVKAALDALLAQMPRDICHRPKDCGALALAAGRHLRLPAAARLRVTQGVPLGKTGFLLQQDAAVATRRRLSKRWPFLRQPGQAFGLVEMIRHQTGLWTRKVPVGQPRTDIMAIGEHATLTPDQHPHQPRCPTGRLQAHHERPGLNQLHQTLLLLGGQLRAATAALAGDQAVQARPQKGPLSVGEPGGAETPALAQPCHGHEVHQQVKQYGGTPHQTDLVLEGGLLQPVGSGFDRRRTDLYPDAHGCILRCSDDRKVAWEIHPFAHGRQS